MSDLTVIQEVAEGDHVTINDKFDLDKKLPFILKRINAWDFKDKMVVKIVPYVSPRTKNQNDLFHLWCRIIAEKMIKRTPLAGEEEWKIFFKREFLGTYDVILGTKSVTAQVKPLPKKVGEMGFFMDQVVAFCAEHVNIQLPVPSDSQYFKYKKDQHK